MIDENSNLVFKYRQIDEEGHTFSILENQELYFNLPSEFNDPFDCMVDTVYEGDEGEWNSFLEEGISNPENRDNFIKNMLENGIMKINSDHSNIKKLQISGDIFSETDSYFRVYCFTQEKDNILMWSHYANNHKGICLSFRFYPGDDFNFFKLDSRMHPLYPVNYQNDLPKQVNFLINYEPRDLLSFLFTKHTNWKYENEHRLIIPTSDFNKGIYIKNFDKKDLEGIIFGLRTPIKHMEKINKIIHKHYLRHGFKVNFYRAKAIPRKYELSIEKIDSLDEYLKINSHMV
ncbi:MAG: hypothetical protein PWQ44_1775 [Methanolobus sp.]|jgi:hypothetical protein|nr:hypothetical protein [Methanolobus sp.]